MQKKEMDANLYNKIKNKLIKDYKIPNDVFKHASKMDFDIVMLFIDALSKKNSTSKIDSITNNILGVYGNYLATHEFMLKGYDVINEYDVIYNNKKITKADIAYYDNNNLVLCEVKAALQIIKDKDNYVYYNYDMSKKEIDLDKRKYVEIGKKLLKQVNKLKKVTPFVKVIIFENCILDTCLVDELKKIGIDRDDMVILSVDIIKLHEHIKNMVIELLK